MSPHLPQADLDAICTILSQHNEVTHARIFGSRALGSHKRGSDVDIVLFGDASHNTVIRISGALNEETTMPYMFDVVAFENIRSDALREHIEQHGIEFYRKEPAA